MSPSEDWDKTRWGRIQQGMRELAVVLKRDVSAKDLAGWLDLDPSSLTGWKNGSRPTEKAMERLEALFAAAGLSQYTARYIDYGLAGTQKEGEDEDAPQPASRFKGVPTVREKGTPIESATRRKRGSR